MSELANNPLETWQAKFRHSYSTFLTHCLLRNSQSFLFRKEIRMIPEARTESVHHSPTPSLEGKKLQSIELSPSNILLLLLVLIKYCLMQLPRSIQQQELPLCQKTNVFSCNTVEDLEQIIMNNPLSLPYLGRILPNGWMAGALQELAANKSSFFAARKYKCSSHGILGGHLRTLWVEFSPVRFLWLRF